MKSPTLSVPWYFNDEPHTVEFKCYPGRPAVMYLKNGDPGYPEDPAEVEILGIYRQHPQGDKEDRDVTDQYADKLADNDSFIEAAWDAYDSMARECSRDGP